MVETAVEFDYETEREIIAIEEQLKASKSRKRWLQCENDFQLFCRTYLPEHFTSEFGKPQMDMVKALESLTNRRARIARAIHRSGGKTTILQAYCLWCVVYKKKNYIAYFSGALEQAVQTIQWIQAELDGNELVIEDFGHLESKNNWSKQSFITSTGIRVVAKGRGASVRGMKHRQHRPDLVILDDIENDKEVMKVERRDEDLMWIRKVALPLLSKDGDAIMIGTVLHWDSVLQRILKDKSWDAKVWKIWDDDHNPTWPAEWPKERIEATLKEIGSEAFASEYLNDPVDHKNAPFRKTHLQFYDPKDLILPNGHMRYLYNFGAVDPAWSGHHQAHYAAMVVVGVDEEGDWWIRDIWRQKHSNALSVAYAIMNFQDKWHCQRWGIETVFRQKEFKRTAEEVMMKRHNSFPIISIDAKGEKGMRIRSMIPRWEWNKIHIPRDHELSAVLADEFLRYPKGGSDDLLDALEDIEEISYKPLPEDQRKRERMPQEMRTVEPETGYLHVEPSPKLPYGISMHRMLN